MMIELIAWALYLIGFLAVLTSPSEYPLRDMPAPVRLVVLISISLAWPALALLIVGFRLIKAGRNG